MCGSPDGETPALPAARTQTDTMSGHFYNAECLNLKMYHNMSLKAVWEVQKNLMGEITLGVNLAGQSQTGNR